MKKFFSGFGIVFFLFLYYQNSLLKIERLEREIHTERGLVSELEKKLSDKKASFEDKINLKEIQNEMRSKHNMVLINEINYFSTHDKSKEE